MVRIFSQVPNPQTCGGWEGGGGGENKKRDQKYVAIEESEAI